MHFTSIAFTALSVLTLSAQAATVPPTNPFEDYLTSVSKLFTPTKAAQNSSGSTENDVVNNVPCRAITILFARGTTEAGNVGTIAGPPFFASLRSKVGAAKVAVQGIEYPADVGGFLVGGDAKGSSTMASLVQTVIARCPNTKLTLSGYSQGGQLVHNAAKQLTAAQTAKIASVVIFGDPQNGKPVGTVPASKTLIICHPNDNICQGGFIPIGTHLTYGDDAATAAAFVQKQAGL